VSGPPSGPAVVVGGGSGIGAAVADRYRATGVEVVVWDRAPGADVLCDITDADQVEAATASTLDRIGTPAEVTVTAGVGSSGLLMDIDPSAWDRVMGINAKGVWLAMRALAMGLYCASKAALDMVVTVAALEWAPAVRVNAVAPGVTDTPMLGPAPRDGPWLSGVAARTALGRLGRPDDIAEAVAAVHGMHWVTGQHIECDGGLARHSPIDPTGRPRP